jgi:hypothetical protein
MKRPEEFLDILETKYKFKLKGSGPISFHLGCDFERDKDGTLGMVPRQYIERISSQYERLFGMKPKTNVTSPLEKGDHPELDDTPLLDEEGIQQYQSLIGSLQWAISIGRIDITTSVMTMSSFRAEPRQGHLDRAKRIVGYLCRFPKAKIRFRTHEPDFSDLPIPMYDWSDTIYGTTPSEVPTDIPTPLGRYVVTVSYVDANLMHDQMTGRSVTGILHFLNATPIDWYSKKMATVETSTYGAEFGSARTCIEQLDALRIVLMYLGVPIRSKSYMFGDNESVVNSSMNPTAQLHKRHNALSFHKVREGIACGTYLFYHIQGENNPADILSKHWSCSAVWHMLRLLFYHEGDTIGAPGKSELSGNKGITTGKDEEPEVNETIEAPMAVGSTAKCSTHSLTASSDRPVGKVSASKKTLQVYHGTSKLGSINLESIVSSTYLPTVRTQGRDDVCLEYFDSHGDVYIPTNPRYTDIDSHESNYTTESRVIRDTTYERNYSESSERLLDSHGNSMEISNSLGNSAPRAKIATEEDELA